MARLTITTALLVMLVPVATADHAPIHNVVPDGALHDMRIGILANDMHSEINPAAGEQLNVTFSSEKLHGFQVVNASFLVAIAQTALFSDTQTGTWRVFVELDGQEVVGCEWFIRSQVLLGVTSTVLSPHYLLGCVLTGIDDEGMHALTVNREVQSGNPPDIQSITTSATIIRQDVVILTTPTEFESLTGLTAQEFAIFPAIAFIGLLLWLRASDGAVRSFGSVLIMLSGALLVAFAVAAGIGSIWRGTIPLGAGLLVIGIYTLVRYFIDLITDREHAA